MEITVKRFLAIIPIPNSPLVRVVRNSIPPKTVDDMEETWGGLERDLARMDRARLVLLLDLRRARGRSDDVFDSVVAKYRGNTFSGFLRVALLVQTLAGLMQVERHRSYDGGANVRAFLDEQEALAWLEDAEIPQRDTPPQSVARSMSVAQGMSVAQSVRSTDAVRKSETQAVSKSELEEAI